MKKNKSEETTKNKNHKFLNLFSGFIVGMFICVTIYLIYVLSKYNGVENILRYALMILLGIICLIVFIKCIRFRKKSKIGKKILFILVLIIFGIIEFFIGVNLNKLVGYTDKINKNEVTYSSTLIALKSGNYNTLKKAKEGKIGITSDTKSIDYELSKHIIKKDGILEENLIEYDDYPTMLNDLYNEDIDAIFVPGNYVGTYSSIERYEKIRDEVIELDKYSKKMKKQADKTTESTDKKLTEPFTILLLGVDSPTEDISEASGLGDSIMLVTFNPKTLTTTMFSIPRDTYVPITCYRNAMSKITHAASGGDSCMINTVEKFTDIDIDYYAKINFKGLVKIVDALGGIEVDVPYSFCEQDSNRSFENLQYVREGLQTLNGEQALALSRNRKEVPYCSSEWNHGTRNDFVRGQNQQKVIKGIINKLKTIKSMNQLYGVLDAVSLSLDTNLTREQILSFYNVFKKILLNSNSLSEANDIINIQKTYLNGSGGLIYDNIMRMKLYEFVPSSQSLNAIVKAMKINLELIEEEYETSFSFSIDNKYEEKVIGEDLYGGVASYPDPTPTCKANEEVGADGVTCVCKNGYSKNSSGVCEKVESVCEANEELGADKVSCVCKNGYSRNSKTGICEKKETKTCSGAYEMAEPLSDGTCGCMVGYERNSSTGLCEKKATDDEKEEENEDTPTEPGNNETPSSGEGDNNEEDENNSTTTE